MKHPARATVILACIVFSAFCQPAQLRELDAFVEQTLTTFDVPGIGVAIVKDGEIVLAKGYGVPKLGESTAADSHTLLGIGSNTKAFTTAALGILVDEGKFSWDDAVIAAARIPDVRPLCDARDDHPRSADASQRAGAWRGRPAHFSSFQLFA